MVPEETTASPSARQKVFRALNLMEEGVIAFLLAAMVMISFTQVVLRYLFGTGLLWALELLGYLFVWLVLLAASYLVKHRGHIGVDLIVKKLPPTFRRITGLAAVAVCLFYSTTLLIGGTSYVWSMFKVGIHARDVPIARWILLLPIPIGLALLLLRFGQMGFLIWTGKETDLLSTDRQEVGSLS